MYGQTASNQPTITSISPTSGQVGTKLTIYGKNLQDDCGKREERVCQLTVSIGGHEIKRDRFVEFKVTWLQDRITLVVPPKAQTGVVRVVRNDGDKSYDITGTVFTVTQDIIACTMEYKPVCGVDRKTYSNKCIAEGINKVKVNYEGECTSIQTPKIPIRL